jgi:PAS domain S-box-containing protein
LAGIITQDNGNDGMKDKATYKDLADRIKTLEAELAGRDRFEEALKWKEEAYRPLIEDADDIIYRINTEGHFTLFNSRAVKTTGYSEEELLRTHYLELIRPDYRENASCLYGRQYAKKIPSTYFEFPMIDRGGQEVWLGQHVQAIVEGDEVIGFHAIARNITRRRLAEMELQAVKEGLEREVRERTKALEHANLRLREEIEERRREKEEEIARFQQAWQLLQESELRYRSVFENSGTATIIIDGDSTITMANTEFATLSGYSRAEIEGKMKWTQMVDPEDLRIMQEYFELRRKKGDSPPGQYEFRLVDRQGNKKHIHLRVAMIPGTDRQVSSLTDITQVRETEKLFRDLFMNAEIGLYILQKGRFRMVNRKLRLMTGYEEEELLGMRSMELVHPEYRQKVQQYSIQMLKGQRISPYEFIAVSREGYPRWILETVAPILYKGDRAVLGNFVDITRNKEMEQNMVRSQKIESIGTLAGGIAHDFNNFLNAILGHVDLSLIFAQARSKLYRNLEEAKKACLSATDLTRRFITFSEGGAPRMKKCPIDQTLVLATNFNLSGTNVVAEFLISNDLWNVHFDEAQIRDVIAIVVRNSVDAMPSGGKVVVSAENAVIDRETWGLDSPEMKGSYVHMTFRDEGSGIPKEYQPRLFDPYFSTKARGKKKGMGLGLPTAYSIVHRHHGHIAIDSTPGTGTTVHIYLPASEDVIESGEPAFQSPRTTGKGRILVMDDEEMVLGVTADLLSHAGYEMQGAREGQEAVTLYKKALQEDRPFDAVILDLTVREGIGGKEAIRQLLEMDPRVAGIISSGYSDDPVMINPQKYGFMAAVQKPYGLEQLLEQLSQAVAKTKRA